MQYLAFHVTVATITSWIIITDSESSEQKDYIYYNSTNEQARNTFFILVQPLIPMKLGGEQVLRGTLGSSLISASVES